jgi:hypothetical protein
MPLEQGHEGGEKDLVGRRVEHRRRRPRARHEIARQQSLETRAPGRLHGGARPIGWQLELRQIFELLAPIRQVPLAIFRECGALQGANIGLLQDQGRERFSPGED